MRFPPYLFGFQMTNELWYILVFIAALLVLWVLTKIFKNLAKDFAGGILVFGLVIVFIILMLNVVTGSSQIESGVDRWFDNLFR
ncbi:MAG: hypothetical protein RBT01_11010 [Anaerolineaceae bacterium]|nr:hypothetical protein [Anaerolineaceae bacterium]